MIYANAVYHTTNDFLLKPTALITISLAYDMLYNDLSTAEKYSIATKIKTLLDLVKAMHFNSDFSNWKTLYGNNAAAYPNSGMGIGAIAIRGDYLSAGTQFTTSVADGYINAASGAVDILDANYYTSDGSCIEGVNYGVFSAEPIIAFYEMLYRLNSTNKFTGSNLKRLHEWAVNELLPAPARHSSISDGMFDFNTINDSYNVNGTIDGPEYNTIIFGALGGIYNGSVTTAGGSTWLFEHHLDILKDANIRYMVGTVSSVILAITKYVDNAAHPDNINDMPKEKIYYSRGLIFRDGYSDTGPLFSFETNYHYNPETNKYCYRHNHYDKNSFTFTAFGKRWIIDPGAGTAIRNSELHNTVDIDGISQERGYDTQPITSFDAYLLDNNYFVSSDITDSWKYTVAEYSSDATGSWQEGSTLYSNFMKAKRNARFLLADDNVPPYVVIYDDIQEDNNSNTYNLYLNTNAPSTNDVSIDQTNKKVQVTQGQNVLDIYYYAASAGNLSTELKQSIVANTYNYNRIKYSVSAVNPRFHTVLVPSSSTTSAVSALTFTNLNDQGSLSTIDFSTNSDIRDFNMFSYQINLDYQGYGMKSRADGSDIAFTGVYGYARKNKTSGEYLSAYMSYGSYLKMDNTQLMSIGGSGKTGRALLKDNVLKIYKVASGGRISYKMYGKNLTGFYLDGVSQSYTAFNDYNYKNTSSVITVGRATVSEQQGEDDLISISYTCGEAHDIKLYFWDSAVPGTVYSSEYTGRSSGSNTIYAIAPATYTSIKFRLEGVMSSDSYTDLTAETTANILKTADAPVVYEFKLMQNYPNPANPSSEIIFELPETGFTQLKIFNSLGQEIKTLVSKEMSKGRHQVRWDGTNMNNTKVPSGIYFYKLTSGQNESIKKMSLLK